MLDIGWTELMVIGVLALLVVGPKELPRLMRTVGQFVAKARGMARDFQRSMEDAAREADLSEFTDLKRDVEKMGRMNYGDMAKRSSDTLNRPKKPTGAAGAADDAAEGKTSETRASDAPGATPDPAPREDPVPAPDRRAASGER